VVCNALKIHCWSLYKIYMRLCVCARHYCIDVDAANTYREESRRPSTRATETGHRKYIKRGQIPSHIADGSRIFMSSSNIDLVGYTFSYALASATVITREEHGPHPVLRRSPPQLKLDFSPSLPSQLRVVREHVDIVSLRDGVRRASRQYFTRGCGSLSGALRLGLPHERGHRSSAYTKTNISKLRRKYASFYVRFSRFVPYIPARAWI